MKIIIAAAVIAIAMSGSALAQKQGPKTTAIGFYAPILTVSHDVSAALVATIFATVASLSGVQSDRW